MATPETAATGETPTRKFARACNVYCRPQADRVVVASVFNHNGALGEKPGGAVVTPFSDAKALHDAIQAALAECEYRAEFDYSRSKLSDWPAYRASGCKSVKRFEAEYVRLLVSSLNEANLFYRITTPNFGDFDLTLSILVNAYGTDFGKAVRYLTRKFLVCQATANDALTDSLTALQETFRLLADQPRN